MALTSWRGHPVSPGADYSWVGESGPRGTDILAGPASFTWRRLLGSGDQAHVALTVCLWLMVTWWLEGPGSRGVDTLLGALHPGPALLRQFGFHPLLQFGGWRRPHGRSASPPVSPGTPLMYISWPLVSRSWPNRVPTGLLWCHPPVHLMAAAGFDIMAKVHALQSYLVPPSCSSYGG